MHKAWFQEWFHTARLRQMTQLSSVEGQTVLRTAENGMPCLLLGIQLGLSLTQCLDNSRLENPKLGKAGHLRDRGDEARDLALETVSWDTVGVIRCPLGLGCGLFSQCRRELRWKRAPGVPQVSRKCPARVPQVSRRCPSSVPQVYCRCPVSVPQVSRR